MSGPRMTSSDQVAAAMDLAGDPRLRRRARAADTESTADQLARAQVHATLAVAEAVREFTKKVGQSW